MVKGEYISEGFMSESWNKEEGFIAADDGGGAGSGGRGGAWPGGKLRGLNNVVKDVYWDYNSIAGVDAGCPASTCEWQGRIGVVEGK